MPTLPAIIRPVFPNLAHRLEFGKQDAHQRDQGRLPVPRQTLDVERADSGLSRGEIQALFKAAEFKSAYEASERARSEQRAIYEGVLDRKQALALAHLSRGHKAIKWRYKLKRTAIKYGCIALAIAVFAIWADHKLFSTDLAPSKPLPRYQSAVDR